MKLIAVIHTASEGHGGVVEGLQVEEHLLLQGSDDALSAYIDQLVEADVKPEEMWVWTQPTADRFQVIVRLSQIERFVITSDDD